MVVTTRQPLNPIRVGDQYEGWVVEREVEMTGLSEVWKVRHFLTGRQAALKVIAEGLVQQEYFLNKFAQEVGILQNMKHPNILGALGCFPVGPRYGVVTPWVEGWTLEKLIRANPDGLPLEDALPLAITLLKTLADVHALNIFHRDIKPNNILIEAATMRPFLIDFGIALVVGEPRKTKYGVVLGNPSYMSPEQIQRFHEVDSRSDIYAFGCVLFEMLTGHAPFESQAATDTERLYEVQRKQIYEPPPLLRDSRSDLPVQLEKVVAMALEKNPDDRYSSCLEFAEFLQAIEPEKPSSGEDKQQQQKTDGAVDVQPPLIPPSEPPRLNAFFHLFAPFSLLAAVILWWKGGLPVVLLGGAVVWTVVSYLVVMYNAWNALPTSETKTTGTKEVLLHVFFPIAVMRFFIAFIPAYNRHVSRNKLPLPEYNENLGIAWIGLTLALIAAPFATREQPEVRDVVVAGVAALCALFYMILISNIGKAVNQLADLQLERVEPESAGAASSNAARN